MATTMRSVGFRLQSEGKAEVKNDFAEVQKAGQDAMAGIAASAEKAANDAGDATDRYTKRQMDAFQRQAAAAKAAAAGITANGSFDQALGTAGSQQFATVNLDRTSGSAREAAIAFEDLFKAEDLAAAKAAEVEAANLKLAASIARARSEAQADSAQRSVDTALAGQGSAGQFATVNLDRSTGQARESASAFQAMFEEQDAAANAAAKLRAAIDPLYVAQQRYDNELKTWALAAKSGEISEEAHAAAIQGSAQRLEAAKNALDQHSNSLGLNSTQFMIAEGAVHRFADSLLAGADPMRAFMMQAGDIGNFLAMDNGGFAGGLSKVRALISPTVLGVAGLTTVVLAGAAAWLSYEDATLKFQAMAQGIGATAGVTAGQLEQMAETAANASGSTVGAAREFETAYLQTGKISGDVLEQLTALTKDYAAATGTDAKEAARALAVAFADPAKGAEDLNGKLGILDSKTLDYIQTLAQENDLTGAQIALLKALSPAVANASTQINGLQWAWTGVKNAASEASTWLAKAIQQAVSGGPAVQQLASLQAQRARMVSDSYGLADTSDIDKQIAALTAKVQAGVAQASQKVANQRAQTTAGIVNSITGGTEEDALNAKLKAVTATLNDQRQVAGMSADQLARTRLAQDELTHATQSYLPEGQKQVELSRLDAQIAATKDPARKAELAAQKSRIEQGGKLITSAQAEMVAEQAGAKAKAEAAKAGENHAATLGREATSMEVNARAALDVADAYLKSSAAGVEADARRKAATDATKKGIDVEAEARRQLDLQVAEGAAAGAKSVAQLREETAARAAANDNVAAGKLASAGLTQALGDEAALRPLLALRTIAQGDAYDKLTKIIDAYRVALADAHGEEARSQAAASLDTLGRRVEDAQLTQQYAGDTSGAYERAKAKQAANREAIDRKYAPKDAAAVEQRSVDAASADLTASRASSAAQSLRSEQDRLAVQTASMGILGKSDDEQQRIIGRLQLQQQLAVSLGDQYDRFAPAILAAHDAADQATARLKVMASAVEEVRDFGADFADKVLSPDTWTSWKDGGKAALKEIEDEFVKLALLNPLKNLINGNSNAPTLGSAFGALTSLFGGASAITAPSVSVFDQLPNAVLASAGPIAIPHNATGTDRFSGGFTYMNENGGEIADLPDGTRIYPAAESRRMMQAANDPARAHVTIGLDNELLTAKVVQIADARVGAAAPGIAQAGAMLGEARAAKRQRYRIPGR